LDKKKEYDAISWCVYYRISPSDLIKCLGGKTLSDGYPKALIDAKQDLLSIIDDKYDNLIHMDELYHYTLEKHKNDLWIDPYRAKGDVPASVRILKYCELINISPKSIRDMTPEEFFELCHKFDIEYNANLELFHLRSMIFSFQTGELEVLNDIYEWTMNKVLKEEEDE